MPEYHYMVDLSQRLEEVKKMVDACHLDRGYLLSYNFNKNKKTGLCRIQIGRRELVEVMV